MKTSIGAGAKVAYFSMEVGFDQSIPTYSGGLGILAGDTLRSAADLGLPLIAVTMLYHKGYFRQQIDSTGHQHEQPEKWQVEKHLTKIDKTITVTLEDRTVEIAAWRHDLRGVTGHIVPIFFLDTKVRKNSPYDQTLNDFLYGNDGTYRLCQEVILGMGGFALLKELGFYPADSLHLHQDKLAGSIDTYHMNEGHSSLITLAILKDRLGGKRLGSSSEDDLNWVKKHCIFTTHTPVPAGHDRFSPELVTKMLGQDVFNFFKSIGACQRDENFDLNMSRLALRFSRFVNGVARRHGQVSAKMFPNTKVKAITNGVHAAYWTSEPFKKLFDKEIPDWRRDNFYLRYALDISVNKIHTAHQEAKKTLFNYIHHKTKIRLDPNTFTIGFARRVAGYKRADLLFNNVERLKMIADRLGNIQIVFAGKAHPKDMRGKELIKTVFHKKAAFKDFKKIKVIYIENYGIELGRLICSGTDLWLNNPVKPLEASGTSGMKAALNGVPSLSTLDGWWVEGHIENVTGWEIDDLENAFGQSESMEKLATVAAANSLYDKLEWKIMPLYYGHPLEYGKMMRNTIAINGAFFNTQRMMLQYKKLAYQLEK